MTEVRVQPSELYNPATDSRLPLDYQVRSALYEKLKAAGIRFKPLKGPFHLYYANPEMEPPWEVEMSPCGARIYRQPSTPQEAEEPADK